MGLRSARFVTGPHGDPLLDAPSSTLTEEPYGVDATTQADTPSLRDRKLPLFWLRAQRPTSAGVDPVEGHPVLSVRRRSQTPSPPDFCLREPEPSETIEETSFRPTFRVRA